MTTNDLKHLLIECENCGCSLYRHYPDVEPNQETGTSRRATTGMHVPCTGDREIQAIMALIEVAEGAHVVKLNMQNNQHIDPFYRNCIKASLHPLDELEAIK